MGQNKYKFKTICIVCKKKCYSEHQPKKYCSLKCKRKKYYHDILNNPEEHLKLKTLKRKIQKKLWIEHKQKVIDFLGGKCVDCGYNKCIASLDIDHLNPNNKNRKKHKYILSLKWKDTIKLLKDCELRCSNCHRERHYYLNHKK